MSWSEFRLLGNGPLIQVFIGTLILATLAKQDHIAYGPKIERSGGLNMRLNAAFFPSKQEESVRQLIQGHPDYLYR